MNKSSTTQKSERKRMNGNVVNFPSQNYRFSENGTNKQRARHHIHTTFKCTIENHMVAKSSLVQYSFIR